MGVSQRKIDAFVLGIDKRDRGVEFLEYFNRHCASLIKYIPTRGVVTLDAYRQVILGESDRFRRFKDFMEAQWH